jgi:predicted acylesterase/phospholipase RssA
VAQVESARRIDVKVVPPDMVFRFAPRVEIPGMPRVALALSGGGARGLAHIGVIQRLEEVGYPLDSLTGTSAGALVAALYASGFSGLDIEALFERLDLTRAFLEPLLRSPGETLQEQEDREATFLSVERSNGVISLAQGFRSGVEVQHTLQSLLARGAFFSGGDFDRLHRPLRILATNLETGQGRVFGKGDLVEAVRASMAIPGGFRPVVIDGQQYVDGALVENLPVSTAREAFHPEVVLAVDISAPLERRSSNSILSVAARSLDLVVERRQWESRAAADFLIRPEIKDVPFFEYGNQGPQLVRQGREAFDARRNDLNALLRSRLGGHEPAGVIRVAFDAPEPLDTHVSALVPPAWADHPETILLQDIQIFLQQVLVHGYAREAWATLDAGRVLNLHLRPFERVRGVVVDATPQDQGAIRTVLGDYFKEGDRYNPETFGRVMSRLVFRAVMGGRPLMDARGSGFDEATGEIRIVMHEPILKHVEIRKPEGQAVDESQLRRILSGVEGSTFRPAAFQQVVALAEHRLNLVELRYQVRPDAEGEAVLTLIPVPQQRERVHLSLGYETNLGGQVGLSYRSVNLGFRNAELDLSAARNRLQEQMALALRRPFGFSAGAGFELGANYWQLRLEAPLVTSFPQPPGLGEETRISASDLDFRTYLRFGNLGTGKASLDLGRRNASIPTDGARKAQAQDSAFLSAEWDNLDRHTLPRDGLMLRTRYGYGEVHAGQLPSGTFRQAYVRARGLKSFSEFVGLDLDLEWGYGHGLPLDRWWVLGGSSFVIGSRAMGYLTPNFGAVRFGVPFRFYAGLGLTLVLTPRFDVARMSNEPGSFERTATNPQVTGAGLVLRTTLSNFYAEGSFGITRLSGPQGTGQADKSFTLLVGTQPFDLWKRR